MSDGGGLDASGLACSGPDSECVLTACGGSAFALDWAVAADRGGAVVAGFTLLGCFAVDLVVEEWCSAGAGCPREGGVDERQQGQQDSWELSSVWFPVIL